MIAPIRGGPSRPVMVYAPPPPEPAPYVSHRGSGETEGEDEPSKLLPWGGAVVLGGMMFTPDLGGLRFSGDGTLPGETSQQHFSHLGRQLGLVHPLMVGGGLNLFYYRRYFEFGVGFFLAGSASGASDVPGGYRAVADLVSPSGTSALGVQSELSFVLPIEPFSLAFGSAFGIREFQLPMTGFQETTCTSKGRKYPCDEEASAVQAFLEPRVRLEIPIGKSPFMIGGYVGMEVVGGSAMTGGVTFGFGTPHAALRP